jgi:agmatinase
VGRRILEKCPLVQVGLRAFSLEERRFLESRLGDPAARVHPFSIHSIRQNPNWIDEVVAALPDPVYVTLDVDGLDPSLLPHTGTPEPGGLHWQECCDLLHAVGRHRNIVGFDLVELAPVPGSRSSDFTVARLCMRLIGLALRPGFEIPDPPF